MSRAVRGGSAAEMAELRAVLSLWAANDSRLQAKGELSALSRNLSILGSIGLHTLEYLQLQQAPPDRWVEEQMSAIRQAEQPLAEVNLAAARPVRMLVEAAGRPRGSGSNK
jgi:hypothetical protein